jgi:hypothetical protein
LNNDEIRDLILRLLYDRHRTARSPSTIPVGIRELNSELKQRHDLKQNQIAGNLDYLIQSEYAREVRISRSFKTSRGAQVNADQVKYKISDTGINRLEAGTVFKKPAASNNINITNVRGVTVVGDGNIVNTKYADLSRALDQLDKAVQQSSELTDEQKLTLSADVGTIRSQVAKPEPSKGIIAQAWEGMKGFAALKSVGEAVVAVGGYIGQMLG